MAFRFVLFLCLQAAALQSAYSQVINRVVPNCGCSNILPIAETFAPNQVILPNGVPNQVYVNPTRLPTCGCGGGCGCGCGSPNVIETLLPNQVIYNPTVLPNQVYQVPELLPQTTTIIQDSTVANNLANALQLMIVSNLLSNTLPGQDVYPCGGLEVMSPLAVPSCGCGLGGYGGLGPYVYY